MNRHLTITGILAASMGSTMLVPLQAGWQDTGIFPPVSQLVGALALILIIGGIYIARRHHRLVQQPPLPVPVRATITGTILFLAFCALEFSDGLVRQDGRVFYWTSVLFLPALALLYGLVIGHRSAWWAARIAAAVICLWFLVFLGLIPFANLQSNGVPITLPGRIYATIVTLVFATVSCLAFRSLGAPEARRHFGMVENAS